MAKMVTLIGAKWREFAAMVAQRHKTGGKDVTSPPVKEKSFEVKEKEVSDREGLDETTDVDTKENGEELWDILF